MTDVNSQGEKRPGPTPERVKGDADNWEDLVRKALDKKRPQAGWPQTEKEPKKESDEE